MSQISSKCFVPTCKNTVGIAFPEDPEIKEKWLEILGIPHLQPEPSSFVCLDHFQDDENEEVYISDGKISNTLKETIQKTATAIKTDRRNIKVEKDVETNESNLSPTKVFSEETDISDTTNQEICRLCMERKDELKNIFVEEIDDGIHIVFAILACIHPIEISYEDVLPKTVCNECFELLRVCFKFRSICLKNDKIQKQSIRKQQAQLTSNSRKSKRKTEVPESEEVPEVSTKKKFKDVDSDEPETYDELEAINEFLVKKNVSATKGPSPNKKKEVSAKPKAKPQEEPTKRMEEELRKVLEGTLSEEQASADNIIIHIQNDDEDSTEEAEVLSSINLPIVITPAPLKESTKKIVRTDVRSNNILSDGTLNENSSTKTYKSNTGVFQGSSLSYLQEIEFCLVDNYLFEYRLCKRNVRYMRCLLPSCLGKAVQKRLETTWLYSNDVRVLIPHDHKPPTEIEKKKQMFYFIMKRKMQSDKTLKFKNVYDEVCEKDPEITELIPLRSVINEICSQQAVHKSVPITSFEALYNNIEEDAYAKLQFTNYGTQFYQEKFTADDNAKAIVFANLETIEMMSESDLMYIDASFTIETNESFSYQLVTVLVWVEESYYPIMFALVNYKTQEIYKKIFEFLHDTLAPKLCPDEIVTEYEANLYYALGEIYVDSSIGGSVFYYTQNLYKKICSLNLAKDLETNNYFRNIYHMLLMLPLLPVNTILDGFNNIEAQAKELEIGDLTKDLFNHIKSEWMTRVTPDLFCVHRLENRINENVIAPFKKLRDYLMLTKGKSQKPVDITTVIEKLIELESFLHVTYSTPNKKVFARDLSSAQKKNVLRAWQFIEHHPKININNFFSRVLGYIKCMENQLWIWGFYRYGGDVTDELINAGNFSIVANDELQVEQDDQEVSEELNEEEGVEENEQHVGEKNDHIVMEAVLDESGGFVLKHRGEVVEQETAPETYVAYE